MSWGIIFGSEILLNIFCPHLLKFL